MRNIESNIWKFYFFQSFKHLSFFLPIIVLFWQKNGLSMTETMILQSFFAIFIVLLEIPTGYFADIYGRRKSLVISVFFLFFGAIIYSLGVNFFFFLIAEFLWAFGNSLISGSDSALIYDSLKEFNREKEFKKIWGKSIFFLLVSMSLANVIGGVIGKINFRWTFLAMLPFLAILIPISASMIEPKRNKLIIKKSYLEELRAIIKYSFSKNKKLKWLLIYAGIAYSFNQAALWLYQPYFSLTGLNILQIGIVFASFQIIAAITAKFSYKIEKKLGEKFSLFLIILLIGVSYLLMGNFIYLFSFTFSFLHQFVRGFSKVVFTDYINKIIPSETRATILSLKNMTGKLIYALIIPFIGWFIDLYSLLNALVMLGIISLIIGSVVFIFFMKKSNLINSF